MEFGPEIKVDGKRPEWLEDGVRCTINQEGHNGRWLDYENKSVAEDWCWGPVYAIKVPADHPHYQQNTPTPDGRAVAPELVSRLVELARSVSTSPECTIAQTVEAQNILAALEQADRVEARRLAGIWEIDEEAAYQILARGRQLEKEGK